MRAGVSAEACELDVVIQIMYPDIYTDVNGAKLRLHCKPDHFQMQCGLYTFTP